MVAALRRLVLLVVGCSIATAAISALFGALIGASLDRSIALGFYGLGCFLMVSGFFVGNRGPARVKSEAAGWTMLPLPGPRRAATALGEPGRAERDDQQLGRLHRPRA